MKPYIDSEITENSKIRVFNSDVDSGELHWHRDRETRLVEVIEGNGWSLQLDNGLPIKMNVGGEYLIPEGIYHRTIKGEGDLKIKITFINE
jgi:oxalate decarboxylase/phosphoglucose isomerase-like protein (cupin superfamily)